MRNTFLPALFLFAAGSAVSAYSAPLSPRDALNRIEKSSQSRRLRGAGDYTLQYMVSDVSHEPTVYVFAKASGEGFVIASAEDVAAPVLGYSDNGTFDPSAIPANLRFWLGEYSREIEAVRTDGIRNKRRREAAQSLPAEAIGPLVKTKWNQGAPYNKYCFELSSTGEETQSVTGCVATAMAQIMYYYKQPAVGSGQISYKHGDSGTYTMDFGAKAFDWSEMLPTYYPGSYTEEEADAVAYLMKACGYSVRMDYGKGESGASGTAIAGALIDYFGYNKNITVQTRSFYTYNDWVQMIYDNLRNVGPLVYNGSALDGGHSFVCDGYDGNGYFHINWGWGGMSDGYYLLDALNPDEFGIGGAAGGYNLGQQVILNIRPTETETVIPQLMQFGNATGTVEKDVLRLKLDDASDAGFQYINPAPIAVTFGLRVENVSNPEEGVRYVESDKKNLEAKQGTTFSWEEDGTSVNLADLSLEEGDSYRMVISTLITLDGTSEWTEVVAQPGKANYVTVTKTADGYEVADNTVEGLKVSDFAVVSDPVYAEMPVTFSATFTNPSVDQLTRNYSAVLFNSAGEDCYKMENFSINVDAGATTTQTWTSVDWYKEKDATEVTEATTFTVRLYDNWMGEYVEGVSLTVTVEPKNKEAKVESTMDIKGATKEGNVYVVDGDELNVALTVKVLEGYFNHTVMLALQAPQSDGDWFTIMHKHFDAIPSLSEGEEQVLDVTMQFADANPDVVYRLEVWGPGDGFNEKALVKFRPLEDGVETILPDSQGRYTVYGIDGTLRAQGASPEILQTLPPGLYIVNGHKLLLNP